MDGNPFEIPPWATRSEGAATIITGMIDPTIAGSSALAAEEKKIGY